MVAISNVWNGNLFKLIQPEHYIPVTVHLLASPVGRALIRYGEYGISSPPYLMRIV